MTEREQWIQEYRFKNDWRRAIVFADFCRCWECDAPLTVEQASRFAKLCDGCRQ